MLACALLLAAPGVAWGADRLVRQWGEDDGLPVRWATDVAQDETGFVWVATRAGLVRWDAQRFEHWSTSEAQFVETGPGNALVLANTDGSIVDLTARHAPAAIPAPEGVDQVDLRDIAIDGDGTLWAGWDNGVWRRDGGAWHQALSLSGERLRRLRAKEGEPLLAVASGGVYAVDDEPSIAWPRRGLADALHRPDGSWVGVSRSGDVIVRRNGEDTVVHQGSWGSALTARRSAVWVASERELVRVSENDEVEPVLLRRDQGGPFEMMVDREGSLWIASSQGLLQLPEPDTSVWTEDDGLPLYLVDNLVPAPDGRLLVVTREYLARIDPTAGGPVEVIDDVLKPSRPCVAGDGTVWTAGLLDDGGAFLAIDGDERRVYATPDDGSAVCTTDDQGNVWFSSDASIVLAGDPPRRVADTPRRTYDFPSMHAEGDRLWWLYGAEACDTSLQALRAGTPQWHCVQHPDGTALGYAYGVVPGEPWFTCRHGPPVKATDAGLEPLDLPAGGIVRGFSPSPRGGLWVYGVETLFRGRPGPDGWTVLELLGATHGIPDTSPHDVYEHEDGTVWLATLSGLVRVPAAARELPDTAPAVYLVEATSDGERLDTGDVVLPYRQNRLALRFSALSYRDPSSVRYRLTLDDGASQVVEDARFRFVDLAPGRYRAEVTASLDGDRWSSVPAVYGFRVRAPWYLQGWALALWAALAGGLAFAAHRARVAHLVGLERQRARIAMDLHDEIGSGLGSIGLLAGVLRDAPHGAAPTSLASTIAHTAEDLGTSLTEIVWALRREAASPAALMDYLEARARGMFPGDGTRIEVSTPERWPRGALSLSVRRNLQSIALEALHNAARHAGASHVELGLAPARGTWRLWVSDDGVGLDRTATPRPGGGSGLEGMRRRAEAIGGRLEVTTAPGEGTTVAVLFEPGATDNRVRSP